MAGVAGIDLGTSNSVIAVVFPSGKIEVIPSERGRKITPSRVVFKEDGSVAVGDASRRIAGRSAVCAKRVRGMRYDNAGGLVKQGGLPMVSDDDQRISYYLDGNNMPTLFIEALILRDLLARGERALGGPIRRLVVALPANYTVSASYATQQLSEIAGLDAANVSITMEPTAAAVSYSTALNLLTKKCLLGVFDMGSGTFDFSLIATNQHGWVTYITTGKSYGGTDMTLCIAKAIRKTVLDHPKVGRQKLSAEEEMQIDEIAERMKIQLTDDDDVKETFRIVNGNETVYVELDLSRADFNAAIEKDIRTCIGMVKSAMQEYGVEPDHIILTGGATRVPLLRDLIQEAFNGLQPLHANAEEAVAEGAARIGVMEESTSHALKLVDITPHTVGVLDMNKRGEMKVNKRLIERHTPFPAYARQWLAPGNADQSKLWVQVLLGDSLVASDCTILADEVVTIKRPDRYRPGVDGAVLVEYTLFSNGTLHVSCKQDGKRVIHSAVIVLGKCALSPSSMEQWRKRARELIALPFGDVASETQLSNPSGSRRTCSGRRQQSSRPSSPTLSATHSSPSHRADPQSTEPPKRSRRVTAARAPVKVADPKMLEAALRRTEAEKAAQKDADGDGNRRSKRKRQQKEFPDYVRS